MKKHSRNIARKYARALFELYQLSEVDNLKASLLQTVQLWEDNLQLRDAMLNPAFSLGERSEALRAIAQNIRPNDTNFANFLALVLKNKRLPELRPIAEALAVIIDEVKKVLSLHISSAFEVPAAEKDSIITKIQSDYGAMASVEWIVDRSLIGGMTIKSGDSLLDGSLKGTLERLRSELLG